MKKIGFAGAPGTGKTTVAQRFVAELRFLTGENVELIDEYARGFVSKFGEASMSDQYLLAHRQVDKELAFPKADYLVTDAPAFLTLIYVYLGLNWKNAKDLHYLGEIYPLLMENFHSYTHVFYSFPTTPTKDDGCRIHTEPKVVNEIHEFILAFAKLHRINLTILEGTLEERAQKAIDSVRGATNAPVNCQ
jgi:nicotinamide riboside kinase